MPARSSCSTRSATAPATGSAARVVYQTVRDRFDLEMKAIEDEVAAFLAARRYLKPTKG